jgi:hypothetical protein
MKEVNMKGYMFLNQKKEKNIQPDYSGYIIIEWQKYYLAGWTQKRKDKENYMNIIATIEHQKIRHKGSFFRNTKKEKDTHPDYIGELNLVEKYRLAVWVLEPSLEKEKYFSITASLKEKNASVERLI